MRLCRIVECATEAGALDVQLCLEFISVTKLEGKTVSATLKWGAEAFGTPLFKWLGEQKVISQYKPTDEFGVEVTKTKRDTKHAEYVPDAVVMWVMDLCHSKRKRRRAPFKSCVR